MTTAYLMRAVGFAGGHDCPHAGQFLEDFQHDTPDGLGFGKFTSDPTKAKQFASRADAMIFWNKQSRVKPYRADGRPNKPLTALSVSVEPAPW